MMTSIRRWKLVLRMSEEKYRENQFLGDSEVTKPREECLSADFSNMRDK